MEIRVPLYVVELRSVNVKDDWQTPKNLSVPCFNGAVHKSEIYQIHPEVKKLSVVFSFEFISVHLGCAFKHSFNTTNIISTFEFTSWLPTWKNRDLIQAIKYPEAYYQVVWVRKLEIS